jgi:hypothetical protein
VKPVINVIPENGVHPEDEDDELETADATTGKLIVT